MISIKSPKEMETMKEGGKKLGGIKRELQKLIKPGIKPSEVDKKAEELIKKAGGEPSFKMVDGYSWATCINVNEGVVHGIPGGKAFKEGDLVSVDVGMFYKGFHTDTSFTVGVGKIDEEKKKFLEIGRKALSEAIKEVRPGRRVAHISRAMQNVLEKEGYSSVRSLTGHGIGEGLHEMPQIPCFWEGDIRNSERLREGMALAVESIYALGSPNLVLSSEDNWTIATRDGKISGLFEDTVLVTAQGPLVITA